MNHDLNRRYVLTDLGMRSLAARAGVPSDTFARHGGVTFLAPGNPNDPARVIRHREHTIGVNRFFAQLAADANRAGWRLDRCLRDKIAIRVGDEFGLAAGAAEMPLASRDSRMVRRDCGVHRHAADRILDGGNYGTIVAVIVMAV